MGPWGHLLDCRGGMGEHDKLSLKVACCSCEAAAVGKGSQHSSYAVCWFGRLASKDGRWDSVETRKIRGAALLVVCLWQ